MKIRSNTSIFNTAFIKRACVYTHRHMAKVEGRLNQWSRLKLSVAHKRHGYSGHAYYNGTSAHISLSPTLDVGTLVYLIYHEFMHIYGYHHKHGCDASQQDMASICTALGLSTGAPIPRKVVAPARKTDLVATRYKQMLKRQKTWGAKLKRAQNAYTKINREVVAYQRRHGERINGET